MIEIESTGPSPTDWELFVAGWIRNIFIGLMILAIIKIPFAVPGMLVIIICISAAIHDEINR